MTESPTDEKEIFEVARKITLPEARRAYLQQTCGENEALKQRLTALLQAYEQNKSFLELPPPGLDVSLTFDHPISEKPGAAIGPYKLLQQIGEGGMGVVFMAEQNQPIQRTIALKIIKAGMDTRQVIARFEAERQALAMMDHPNIAKVLDAGTTDSGRPYFVMELVKGVPITRHCDEKHLPLRARLELMLPVCQAVQHAHQKGLIHRDLKPSNVLVAEYDDRAVPKVIDFGVAKATAQKLTDRTMFTEFGQLIGTLEYMSPEQAKINQLDIDTRSDIYSLGVLLYELLTGATPFSRKRLQDSAFDEMLRIIREEEPPVPSTCLSTAEALPNIAASRSSEPKKLTGLVKGELDWIVMKALEKDRNRRYDTANSFALDMQRYLAGEAVLAAPPSAGYRLRKFIRRNRPQVIAASLVVVTLLAGIVGTTLGLIEAKRQERLAVLASQRESERADAEAMERQRADAEKSAIGFRDQALDALRAATGDDVEKLIGAKKELSANEREYLEAIVKRWQGFAKQSETDVDARVYQAEGHFRVASLWQKLGRREEARAEYQLARDGRKLLVEQFPTEPAYQQDLAKTQINLAILLAELGKRGEAQAAFQSALDTQSNLVDRYPAVPEYQKFLAIIRYNFGGHLYYLGKLESALVEIQAARDLQKKLIEQFPATREYERDLARTQSNLGVLLRELEKPDEALAEYQAALEMQKKMAEQFPTETEYEVDLADTHDSLGILLREMGKLEQARREHAAAVDLRKKLAEQYLAVSEYQLKLGNSYCNYGNVLHAEGNLAESLDWYNRAVRTLQQCYQQEPRDTTTREYLRNSHRNRAELCDQLQKYTEATNDWDRVIELSAVSEQPEFRVNRANSRVRGGMVNEAIAEVDELLKLPDWTAGELYNFACIYSVASGKIADKQTEYADRAMELLHKAVQAGFNNATWLAKDSDFDSLRDREDFKKLLESVPKSPARP